MVVSKSTATAAELKAIVKTGMTDSEVETLLDQVVYPIVNAIVGGHTLDDSTNRIRSAELVIAMWFVRQRDPLMVTMPGLKYQFTSYEEAWAIAFRMINSSIDEYEAIRVVNASDTEADYVLRAPGGRPRAHSPPF